MFQSIRVLRVFLSNFLWTDEFIPIQVLYFALNYRTVRGFASP